MVVALGIGIPRVLFVHPRPGETGLLFPRHGRVRGIAQTISEADGARVRIYPLNDSDESKDRKNGHFLRLIGLACIMRKET